MCSGSRNSHSKFAVQAGRHTTHFTVDTLFGHNIFGASTFPIWPFQFIVTSHKKSPRTQTPQMAPKLFPSLVARLRDSFKVCNKCLFHPNGSIK